MTDDVYSLMLELLESYIFILENDTLGVVLDGFFIFETEKENYWAAVTVPDKTIVAVT